MRRPNASLRWAMAGALCLAATQVQAQDSSEAPDADEFVPGVVSFNGLTGLMTVPTAETLPQYKFSFGAYYDTEIESDSRGPRDTDSHVVALGVAVGLHDRFEIGVQVPFVWFENDTLTPDPAAGQDLNIQGLGDVTAQGKFALFRRGVFLGQESSGETTFPFGLSLTAGVRFGTGQDDARSFAPALGIGESTGEDTFLVGGLVDLPLSLGREGEAAFPGPLLLTAGVGGEIPFDDTSSLGEDLDSIVTYHAGLEIPVYGGYYLPGEKLSLEVSLIGETNRLSDGGDDPLAIFGGLRYEVGNGFGIGAGVRSGLVRDIDDYRGLMTLTYAGPVPKPRPEVIEVLVEAEVVPAVVPVPTTIIRERLILPDVNFAFDESTLSPLGKGKIYLLANLINERRVESIVIEGHTDERGPAEYNLGLAQRRADAIRTELIRLGIPASWLTVQSYGESKPLIPQQGEWAWSVNRRVEVLITPAGGETLRAMPAASK